jgi:hypothetical protein
VPGGCTESNIRDDCFESDLSSDSFKNEFSVLDLFMELFNP